MKPITEYQFFKKLTELPFVEAIYLYGSRARGDARWNSDIDLALSIPGAKPEILAEVQNIIDDADTLLAIDYVWYEGAPQALRNNILNDGVPLYVQS